MALEVVGSKEEEGVAEEAGMGVVEVEVELLVATLSQEGHIVKVVAGNCM